MTKTAFGRASIGAMALLFSGLVSPPVWPQQNPCAEEPDEPCFTDIDDILTGRRQILRNDDLVLQTTSCGDTGVQCTAKLTLLRTESSRITGAVTSEVKSLFAPSNVLTGRLFNLPYEVSVQLVRAYGIVISDPVKGTHSKFEFDLQDGIAAIGDFNRDGFADIAKRSFGRLQIFTAKDPSDPAMGLRAGPPYGCGDCVIGPEEALATGDFDADGVSDIAYIGFDKQLTIYKVNPETLEISVTGSIPEATLAPGAAKPMFSLAAGRFSNAARDQLILAVGDRTNNATAKVISIDFTPDLKPTIRHTWDTGVAGPFGGEVVVERGAFNWSGQFEQVALKLNPSAFGQRRLQILSFDQTLKVIPHPALDLNSIVCSSGLTVGNFDRKRRGSERDPNLQIALPVSDCASKTEVYIYDVDPNDFRITIATNYNTSSMYAWSTIGSLSIVSGDLQGRSMELGAPTKIVIGRQGHVNVVNAVPPMHVDYVPPARRSDPTILNLSRIRIFNGQFSIQNSTSNQSSTKTNTSWSAGLEEEGSVTYSVGDLKKGSGAELQNKTELQQKWEGEVEEEHKSTKSGSFNVAQSTGGDDSVWFSESRLNIYVYPVLGKKFCPVEKPACTEAEKLQMTIQFSGQDVKSRENATGSSVEWYQPPWEPGNVLSYPGNLTQLQVFEPDLSSLSDTSQAQWYTDASILTETTKWNTQTSDSESVSSEQNYSFKNTTSFSAAGTVEVLTARLDLSLSVSGSLGFSSLNTDVTTLGSSTGIVVNKPGTFVSPEDYQYGVKPIIYGHARPEEAFNDLPSPGDLKSFGALQTAFMVDPLISRAGAWWRQTYTKPDLALNHPRRWTTTLDKSNPDACLPTRPFPSGSVECIALAQASPDNPWMDHFHTMKGFFISEWQAGGQGPQLASAHAGDKLQLQARVHNYSLAEFPPDTKVHVRFYGVPWNIGTHRPDGSSFLIGESVVGAIPAFNTDTNKPNWQLAALTQPFDTTPYAGKHLVFWVIVWAVGPDGRLVGEMPAHGLRSIPGNLTSLGNAANVEEAFSNNVGFYKWAFYVLPKPTTNQAPSSTFAAPSGQKLIVGPAELTRGHSFSHVEQVHQLLLHRRTEIGTTIRSAEGPLDHGMTVVFYDGDPNAGGKAFDVEFLPHVPTDSDARVRVSYTPEECGRRELYIVAGRGSAYETTRRVKVNVACPSL